MLGFTKKGKQFYSFDTNLAESISSFHVIDNSIWLTGEYTFTQLVDHAEAQFYIAPDRINDSDVSLFQVCHPSTTTQVLMPQMHSLLVQRSVAPAVDNPCAGGSWLYRAMCHIGLSGSQHSCVAEVNIDPSGTCQACL